MINHMAYSSANGSKVTIVGDTVHGERTRVFDCTMSQYNQGMKKYRGGERIQDAFEFLLPDEREFLLSGMSNEEWDELFPPEPFEP